MAKPFVLGRRPESRTAQRGAAIGGSARTPRVGMTPSDLQSQGEKYGWTVHPLTMLEINQMSSAELKWHEEFNRQALDDLFNTEANKRHNKEVKKVVDARRMWRNATDEESASAQAAGAEFAARYPAFVRHTENALAIARYMETHDLDATRVESYAEAFTELAMQGAITLSPRDAGVGPEARLTGNELKSYPRLHLLLQPSRVLKPEDKLSADEYFAQHPELNSNAGRVPPVIQARIAKAQATSEYFKKAETNTARSGATSVTDYKQSGNK